MREIGINLSDRVPRKLTRDLADKGDVVVTMGSATSARTPRQALHRPGPARPKGRTIDEVRATRDDVARRVDALVAELDQRQAGVTTRRDAPRPIARRRVAP